jgi:ABC-type multidrug transport system ATPase subunit
MMTISLSDAGKRYNRDWIFRHFNYQFEAGQSYAITGPNGSGKSTLLQVLGGVMQVNEGKCGWTRENKTVAPEKVYSSISIAAPYLELIEEMTAKEFLDFHQGFKPFLPGLTINGIADTVGLSKAINKQIRYYSSGMKQRLKLAQCILSATDIILLDEPCTNLDADGVALYHQLIKEYGTTRMIVVSSNDEVEYSYCEKKISVMDYK